MNDATITNGYTPLEILAAMTVIDNLLKAHDRVYLYITNKMTLDERTLFETQTAMRGYELRTADPTLDADRVTHLAIAMLNNQAWTVALRIEPFQSRLNSKF